MKSPWRPPLVVALLPVALLALVSAEKAKESLVSDITGDLLVVSGNAILASSVVSEKEDLTAGKFHQGTAAEGVGLAVKLDIKSLHSALDISGTDLADPQTPDPDPRPQNDEKQDLDEGNGADGNTKEKEEEDSSGKKFSTHVIDGDLQEGDSPAETNLDDAEHEYYYEYYDELMASDFLQDGSNGEIPKPGVYTESGAEHVLDHHDDNNSQKVQLHVETDDTSNWGRMTSAKGGEITEQDVPPEQVEHATSGGEQTTSGIEHITSGEELTPSVDQSVLKHVDSETEETSKVEQKIDIEADHTNSGPAQSSSDANLTAFGAEQTTSGPRQMHLSASEYDSAVDGPFEESPSLGFVYDYEEEYLNLDEHENGINQGSEAKPTGNDTELLDVVDQLELFDIELDFDEVNDPDGVVEEIMASRRNRTSRFSFKGPRVPRQRPKGQPPTRVFKAPRTQRPPPRRRLTGARGVRGRQLIPPTPKHLPRRRRLLRRPPTSPRMLRVPKVAKGAGPKNPRVLKRRRPPVRQVINNLRPAEHVGRLPPRQPPRQPARPPKTPLLPIPVFQLQRASPKNPTVVEIDRKSADIPEAGTAIHHSGLQIFPFVPASPLSVPVSPLPVHASPLPVDTGNLQSGERPHTMSDEEQMLQLSGRRTQPVSITSIQDQARVLISPNQLQVKRPTYYDLWLKRLALRTVQEVTNGITSIHAPVDTPSGLQQTRKPRKHNFGLRYSSYNPGYRRYNAGYNVKYNGLGKEMVEAGDDEVVLTNSYTGNYLPRVAFKSGYSERKKPKKVPVYVPIPAKKKNKLKLKVTNIYHGFKVDGGTEVAQGVKSLKECMKICALTPTCFSGDYNKWAYKCYIHEETACGDMEPHPKVIHFQKVPCELDNNDNAEVNLGQQAFGGLLQKEATSLTACLKACETIGGVNVVRAERTCWGVDYDFATHKCYIFVRRGLVCQDNDLVDKASVVNIRFCT